jgi:hypothetical protein
MANGNGKARKRNGKKEPDSARLRAGELIVPRFVLNQPGSGLGVESGWFRNTFTGEEHETLRLNVLLWRRGRVYFEDGEDTFPVCKSNDGLRPAPFLQSPKNDSCGHWNGTGRFVPACRLAAWRFADGRRIPPLCKATWNFLAVLEDDDLPFWISLKGHSLRSARRFLSMCHEVTRRGKPELLDCCITLSSVLVQGRSFDYYVVRFSDPVWLDRQSARHRKLKHLLNRFGPARIQETFDAEVSEAEVPVTTG